MSAQELDSVIADTLRDLGAFDMEDDTTTPVVTTARKAVKRAEGRTGRSAFVDPICADHPDWEFEDGSIVVADGVTIHCARFGHLPGRGRGIHQPSALTIIRYTTAEFIKPLLIIALLLSGFWGLKHFVLGGNFLRPEHSVQDATCRVPDSSEQRTDNAVRDSVANAARRNECRRTSVPTDTRVAPK